MDHLSRARAYLAKLPPAISGSNGSGVTFYAACILVQGFALDAQDALSLMREYNARCVPPWSERELGHKITDAMRETDQSRPRGYLLGKSRQPAARFIKAGQLASAILYRHTRSSESSLPPAPPQGVKVIWKLKRKVPEPPGGIVLEPPTHTVVRTDEELKRLVASLAASQIEEIALAAESAPDGTLRLLTLYAPPLISTPAIIDVTTLSPEAATDLSNRLSETMLVVHGAQEVLRLLAHWQPESEPGRLNFWCTRIAAKLAINGLELPYELEATLKRHVNVTIARASSDAPQGETPVVVPSLARVADTARHLLTLKDRLAKSLADKRLERAFALELRLLPVTYALNSNGWSIDLPGLRAKRERIATTLATPGSTNTAPLRSRITQIDGWLRRISPDGRLRCKYNSLGAVTGRFSASEPNLQGVPRDLREAFCAGKGCSLVIGDLSQIELRIAALVAGDRDMLNIFRRGLDLHRMTAAAVLHKAVDDVTNDERQLGKAANFGLIYGQGVLGFVRYARDQGVDLTEAKATRIRDRFFETYVGIADWHRRARYAISTGKGARGQTVIGRRRYLANDADEWDQFQARINYAVQGSAAELFKTALVELHPPLEAYRARLIGVVHDEVIVEAPSAVTERVTKLLKCTFEEAFIHLFDRLCKDRFEQSLPELFRDRPACEVQTHVCMNWAEKR